MSSATWRNVFTYNKYTQIAARALRASLKEEERVAAEKRGLTILRYQHWQHGQGGPQVRPILRSPSTTRLLTASSFPLSPSLVLYQCLSRCCDLPHSKTPLHFAPPPNWHRRPRFRLRPPRFSFLSLPAQSQTYLYPPEEAAPKKPAV
ncbi:hypothetical protein L226DRAFT_202932 [Lentinus tigrinus ALCF2SS1-7]|uniref:Mitochondrial ATP synthase epsilon chain domain-containing protein n=1 Tax=Lentinus tigrinus ALCF2SS1-6 TaxID=1328759 RepID=A0A5C2SRU6_9APHY|nr:hypothetical protein L227DRAFT_149207 [Lentinus tigrinus ALCF2SS1-6]RPD80521.1 hypothetical protein L226DRAFT_202932 [Lentinus tigrinus ALCF2SS1-7]